jgi:prepilin-type N-terminal cleavage/methylation domain-containing protein
MKANHSKTSHGFTLVELLVSMVITTIIITILVTVTVTSMDIWNRSRAEVRASLQAKAMVDSMAADFESMVVRRGNDFQWLFAEFAPTTNSDGDVDGPNGNLSPSALDLIFFSAATDRYDGKIGDPVTDKGGDVSGIGYKLVYKDPIGETNNDKYKTFVLYRKIVNPDETFKNLLGQLNLKTAFTPYSSGGVNSVEAKENFVCENIYQFTVKFYVDAVDNDNRTRNIPITPSSTNKTFIVSGTGLVGPTGVKDFTDAALAAGKITSVEVSLTVLTDGAIKQLRGRSFEDEQLSDFIAENSYQYSKLIPVPSY